MPQRPPIVVNSTTKNRLHRRTSTEWSIGSASDGSLVDSSNSPEDESIEKLKSEIFNLKELSEMETRTLRKQLTKETKRAQDLSREVMDIKEDRDALERECEQLRLSRKNIEAEALDRVRAAHEGSRVKLEEMRKELNHEKELKLNLELQLQKTQESNSELILAVQDLDDMLKEKNIESGEDDKQFQCPNCRCRTEDNESHQAESTNRKLTGEGNDANTNEVDLLKEQITDLSDEIEAYKESRERLEKYIEQLTRDYEDLKQEKMEAEGKCSGYLAAIEEYESQLEKLQQKLREQTQEQSEALLHINELEGQVKALEQELENQTEGFHKHLDVITQAKVEEEQRAIRAEEALRKSRWKNASTAERLQDDFKRLSQEMAGKIDENEKLMANAVTESENLREENRIMAEKLNEAYEEIALIKNQTKVRTEELSNQLDLRTKMIEEISSDAEEKSVQLENLQKQEKERQEAFAREIQMLKAKIEELTIAGASIWVEEQEDKSKDEQDQAKASLAKTTLQINGSETKYSAAKQEAEKAVRELENLRRVKTCTEQELDNCNLTEILSEMAQLKERNKRMAGELKEMEVMYSDISLKFAEVEGERQQLVMTVRNLKNSKKN
ncbi:Laminin subunit alpha-2 [Linum grandiflorum]